MATRDDRERKRKAKTAAASRAVDLADGTHFWYRKVNRRRERRNGKAQASRNACRQPVD